MSQFAQREFLELDDAARAAQLQSKCFADYAQRCQDGGLRELLQNCAVMHQRHFERLAQCIAAGRGKIQATTPGTYPGYGYQGQR